MGNVMWERDCEKCDVGNWNGNVRKGMQGKDYGKRDVGT